MSTFMSDTHGYCIFMISFEIRRCESSKLFFFLRLFWGLAGVAQWNAHRLANGKVAGSFPSQGTCLGCWARSPVGGMWKATTHWCFSPSLSPSLPLSLKNKINKIFFRKRLFWLLRSLEILYEHQIGFFYFWENKTVGTLIGIAFNLYITLCIWVFLVILSSTPRV